jgi:hypothetical protein
MNNQTWVLLLALLAACGNGSPSNLTPDGGADATSSDGGTAANDGGAVVLPDGGGSTGMRDMSFGSGGLKDTGIPTKELVHGWLRGDAVYVATDPLSTTTVSNVPPRLLKFSLDGTPDSAWNTAASAAIAGAGNFGGRPAPWLLDVDATGRVWIVQTTSGPPPAGGVYSVVRLTPAGAFDKKFLIPRPTPTQLQGDSVNALAIAGLADGSFVVQTGYGRSNMGTLWFISRFDATGALVKQVQPKDTTTGPVPRALFHVAADGSVFALRTQRTLTTDTTICVVKLNAAFDDVPATCFDGLQKEFFALTSSADGKLIALGNAPRTNNAAKREALAMRFNADGTVDPTFGANGEVRVTFSPGQVSNQPDATFEYAWQDASRRWVFGGNTHSGGKGSSYYTLWRTDENGVADSTFGFSVSRGDIDDISLPVRQERGQGSRFGADVVLVPLAEGKVLGFHGDNDTSTKTLKVVRFQ